MQKNLQNKKKKAKVLLVDLNNAASFPTLAIGYLATPLIEAGYEVDVFSPLAHGVKPVTRDLEENILNYLIARIHFAANPLVSWANEYIFQLYNRLRFRPTQKLKNKFRKQLEENAYDAVLVSTYLQFHQLMVSISGITDEFGIPLLLGGPNFNLKEVTEKWIDVRGVTAIYGGEPDFVLPEIVDDLINRRDLKRHPGVFVKEITVIGQAAPPIALTDNLPIPNFDYFPWDNYPHRIIPIMSGRGCGWGKCLFCSDVITASTRSFRSRSLSAVLNEIRVQAQRYQAKDFIFFDSKLNSDLSIWYGLIDNFQKVIPGGHWIASVHVDGKGENGLDRESLATAYESGLRRISFGLETGSEKLNKLMHKGTSLQRISAFIKDAHSVGISVRITVILGYPGETPEDVDATFQFLKKHEPYIDRVKLSKFKAIPGTRFHEKFGKRPDKYPSVAKLEWDYLLARAKFSFQPPRLNLYRQAKSRLLRLVHIINQKSLMDEAQQFNGLM